MRVLIVGLGSMGKRRIRNLKALGVMDVLGCDLRPDRREEASRLYGIPVFEQFAEALAARPDAVVISPSPDLHVEFAERAIEARLPFFTEASVVSEGMTELIEHMRRKKVLGVPSCTMRYYAGPRRLQELISKGTIGRVLCWVYHSGQYLPDWHPWESIHSYYVSKRATGGCREIVAFELVWLSALLGPIAEVSGRVGKLSDLTVDIDDIYQLQARHESGVLGQLTVDVLARPAVRHLRLLGSEGTLEWEASRKLIRAYSSASDTWTEESLSAGTVEQGYLNPEEPYIEEMADFLACVRGDRQPSYTFEEDLAILRVLESAEESDRRGERVPVPTQVEQPQKR